MAMRTLRVVAAAQRRTAATMSAKHQGLPRDGMEITYEKIDHVKMDMMQPAAAAKFEVDLDIARRRLLYQSAKRGMIEMDIMLGEFAKKHIFSWDKDQLMQWNDILRQFDNDLYCWLVRRSNLDTIPQEINESPMFQLLVEYALDENKHKEAQDKTIDTE